MISFYAKNADSRETRSRLSYRAQKAHFPFGNHISPTPAGEEAVKILSASTRAREESEHEKSFTLEIWIAERMAIL